MTLTNKIKSNRGFSLMEFLIVIGILAVIAIIAIPITVGVINSSNKQNDEVLASTYSEYMQKFATEQAGNIGYYPTLKDDGAGSDYDLLKNSSGKGSFPGITQLDSRINQLNEDEVWNLIRKEACIAISAYSGEELADPVNYYVEKPHDDSMAFVYYYLTGTVALKPVTEMENSKITSSEVEDGNVDTEDFWVYLDRPGGSGKAVSASPERRDFYVKVIQFGTGLPVGGAEVTIFPWGGDVGSERTATTTASGLLVFRDVYNKIDTGCTKLGALDWWTEENYSGFEHKVDLATEPNAGTLANPFIIYLKMGTLGGLDLQEEFRFAIVDSQGRVTYKTSFETIEELNQFKAQFNAKEYDTVAKSETFINSSPLHNPFDLRGYDECSDASKYHFLLYGDYGMNITNLTNNSLTGSPNFLPYSEDITSDIYGIYNTANKLDKYVNAGDAYNYPVVLKRNDTYVIGTIASENAQQPLHGTINSFQNLDVQHNFGTSPSLVPNAIPSNKLFDGLSTKFLNATTGTVTKGQKTPISQNGSTSIESYILAVSQTNSSITYRSAKLEPLKNANGTYKTAANGAYLYSYELCIEDKHSGEKFDIYLVTKYGGQGGKMTMSKWPMPISADGCTYRFVNSDPTTSNLDAKDTVGNYVQVKIEDVATTNFKVYCYENNNETKALSYDVTIERLGSAKVSGLTTMGKPVSAKKETSATADEQGVANFSNVKKGFYLMTVTFDKYKGSYPTIQKVVFIGDGDYVFRVDPIDVEYDFVCIPKQGDGTELLYSEKANVFKGNGSQWAQIGFDVYFDNVKVPSSAITVSFKPNDNRAYITVKYARGADYVKVVPNVTCFDCTEVFEHSGSVLDETKTHSFGTTRIENTDYGAHPGKWHWVNNGTTHTEHCDRCDFGRYTANHYVDGSGQGRNTTKYFTNIYTSDNDEVHAYTTGHIKHCDICDLYDLRENCSTSDTWIAKYNYANGGTAHSTDEQHKDSNSRLQANYVEFTGEKGNPSNSDTRHYKYCTLCGARNEKANHSSSWTGAGHTGCKSGSYGYKDISESQHQYTCNDCGYTRTAVNHDDVNSADIVKVETYYDQSGNVIGAGSGAYKMVTEYFCHDCGHLVKSAEQILHTNHSWTKSCGYMHKSGNWSGFDGCTHTGHAHCWSLRCGNAEVDYVETKTKDDGTEYQVTHYKRTCGHTRAYFSCITCNECGVSKYTVLPQYWYDSNGKEHSNWSVWCGAHYGGYNDKGSIMWCETYNGQTNVHRENLKPDFNNYWGD